MRNPDRLRAEAESLAADLPDLTTLSNDRPTAQPGGAPRQRAGHGEDFWQYRSQTPEDSAAAIDWRRSATGDDFYIREHELQTARLLEIGIHASAGFDWTGDDGGRFTKADEARVILTALALRFVEDGDLAAVLGSGKRAARSSQLSATLIEDTIPPAFSEDIPSIRRDASYVVLASDFYGDVDKLKIWMERSAATGTKGILLQVVDPLEAEFPFSGRVKFSRPGSLKDRIFGRTEGLKEDYLERFNARQALVKDLAQKFGWTFETHIVGEPRRPVAFKLLQTFAHPGGAG